MGAWPKLKIACVAIDGGMRAKKTKGEGKGEWTHMTKVHACIHQGPIPGRVCLVDAF